MVSSSIAFDRDLQIPFRAASRGALMRVLARTAQGAYIS
jgi:hypothetical protein